MRIRKVLHHGQVRFRVSWQSGGRQHRSFFSTLEAARKFAAARERARGQEGDYWLAIDHATRAVLIAALEMSARGDYSVVQACEHFERTRGQARTSADVGAAVGQCREAKAGQNLRPESFRKLCRTLERFSVAFAGRAVEAIAPAELEKFLGQWPNPATRKTIRTDLQTFFNWAVGRGLVPDNPVHTIPVPLLDEKRPPVLKLVQARALMEAAARVDRPLCGFFALGLFCGIRPRELLRLSAGDLHLEEGYVEVAGAKAKTRAHRVVEIPENALAWCRLGCEFPVKNWRKRFDLVRAAAGLLEGWGHDVMRHSAASYHLARHGQADRTATMLGHRSTDMLHRVYKRLVRPADGVAFFKIVPGVSIVGRRREAKVVPLGRTNKSLGF